jgi:hypothetical protein
LQVCKSAQVLGQTPRYKRNGLHTRSTRSSKRPGIPIRRVELTKCTAAGAGRLDWRWRLRMHTSMRLYVATRGNVSTLFATRTSSNGSGAPLLCQSCGSKLATAALQGSITPSNVRLEHSAGGMLISTASDEDRQAVRFIAAAAWQHGNYASKEQVCMDSQIIGGFTPGQAAIKVSDVHDNQQAHPAASHALQSGPQKCSEVKRRCSALCAL